MDIRVLLLLSPVALGRGCVCALFIRSVGPTGLFGVLK